MVSIISLGGSIVAPDEVDTTFVSKFKKLIVAYLQEAASNKIILIVGGGAPARAYQNAFKNIVPNAPNDDQDWIGIMATRLNAELIRASFVPYCQDPVVTDPSAAIEFGGQVLVAAGWKPGFSTDFDAVYLADRFGAKTVINLSNISKVFTADPKEDPNAKAVDAMTWSDFRAMVGDSWQPGRNVPFDPIASKKAEQLGLKVIVAGGRDLNNLRKILDGQDFFGTVIS